MPALKWRLRGATKRKKPNTACAKCLRPLYAEHPKHDDGSPVKLFCEFCR